MKYLNIITLTISLLMATVWQTNGFARNTVPSTKVELITNKKVCIPFLGTMQASIGIINTEEQPEWAFLGVYSMEVSEEKAEKLGSSNSYGSYVTSVIGNTAAEKAGILPFDYIYGVDEYRTGAEQNLIAILRRYKPDDKATIYLIRKGEKKAIDTKLGRRSDAQQSKRSECEDPFLGVSQIGQSSLSGVRVNIVDNSTAASIGIPNGAIITHINDYRIYDWTDMGIAIDMLNIGETIRVNYLDEGNKKTASGAIKSYCETKSRTNILFDWDIDFDKKKAKENTLTQQNATDLPIEVGPIPPNEVAEMNSKIKGNLTSHDNLSVEDLKIMSQPGSGLFRLQFELSKQGETDVRIYNTSGREIYNFDLGPFTGKFSDDIDIAQNGPGNYYLLIRQSGKTFNRKMKLGKK